MTVGTTVAVDMRAHNEVGEAIANLPVTRTL
jgi:hypothetical protein